MITGYLQSSDWRQESDGPFSARSVCYRVTVTRVNVKNVALLKTLRHLLQSTCVNAIIWLSNWKQKKNYHRLDSLDVLFVFRGFDYLQYEGWRHRCRKILECLILIFSFTEGQKTLLLEDNQDIRMPCHLNIGTMPDSRWYPNLNIFLFVCTNHFGSWSDRLGFHSTIESKWLKLELMLRPCKSGPDESPHFCNC